MPGHLKKSEGPDPDPKPWLEVSEKLKNDLKCKPYDGKKSCWVPDKASGGYLEGLIDSSEGDKISVTILETKDVSAVIYSICVFRLNSRFKINYQFHFTIIPICTEKGV